MSELLTRILMAIVLIPLALFALYYGGTPLVLALYVIATLGSLEYIQMLRKTGLMVSCWWIYVNSFAYLGLVYLQGFDLPIIWLVLLVGVAEALFSWDAKQSVAKLFASLFGFVYTGLLPAMITRIGIIYTSKKILLALILMIWIVDSIAYIVGMKFGKNRNVTAISPRKSVEGFLAGVIAPWVIVIILFYSKVNILSFLDMALIALAAGIFGQLGDLLESMLKRYCDVKDSSNLIPGHGGILDRSDSILLAGSFLYCAQKILENVR